VKTLIFDFDGTIADSFELLLAIFEQIAPRPIIKKEHLNRVDCVYIGDEVRDVEAAKKAGVKSVGVTWGFNNAQAIKTADPDITANQPKDLLNI
jgi:phosphoglycolate phosphatase